MKVGSFHTHDGWTFQRDTNGDVIIRVDTLTTLGTRITIEHRLDADSWCSVVAHVSPHGDCAEAFEHASRLHQLGLSNVPRVDREGDDE